MSRGRPQRVLFGGSIAAVALAFPAVSDHGAAAGEVSARPTFHAMTCPDDTFPADRDVDCGYVVVPEDRHDPDGRTIRVAAAVVHATAPDPGEPIVFLDGGPSFGAISDFALGAYFADWPAAEEHDLVLVDTRGTGISRPRLGCRELDRANVLAFYAGRFANDEAPRIFGHALDRCWQRYTDRGIDLAAYNSRESADDLESLRNALGYPQWNLLAASADGTVGLTYLRRFPDGIRSVIVDSGMAPNAEWGLDYLVGSVEVLDRVFAGCHADAQCRARYPHVRRLFEAKARQLNRDPALVTVPRMRPEPVTLLIDGASIYTDAISFIYPGDSGHVGHLQGVLHYAWRAAHGHLWRMYRRLLGTGPITNSHDNDFVAQGKTESYVCRDYVSFITHADRVAAARAAQAFGPRILRHGFDLARGYGDPRSPAGCRHWPVGRAGHRQHELVESDVPALVLSNRFDIGTPPRMVRPMLPGLSNSTYVVLPAAAHLSLASYTNGSNCARAIATEFLDDPSASPDTSCLAGLPRVDFTPVRQQRGCGGCVRSPWAWRSVPSTAVWPR
ncbi:alpha/beta fold hydrolase [Nocardioides sp. MH1]|uniref:alpha/beta fold hydrolase n=1 Tax=Nocardioides sp. MH1 TaxID=3242490 RepID=UPI003522DF0B